MIEKLIYGGLFRRKAAIPELPRRAFVHALLEIYERYGVYIGGQLELKDLVTHWEETGFRKGDLEVALADASAWGVLKVMRDFEVPVVKLVSADLPLVDYGQPVSPQMSQRAAERSLQMQRLHRRPGRAWDGVERRKPPTLS